MAAADAPVPPEAQGALESGRAALRVGDWAAAAEAFEAALREVETPEALEALALAAWWLDDPERVLSTRERAYRLYRARLDQRGAARLAIALAGDYLGFRGEPAVARGWQRRARQLLEGLGPVPEHGWLQIAEGDFALSVDGDPELAAQGARGALEVAEALDVEDLRTLAHALGGASLVVRGELKEGLGQLDAAVTTALSGDLEDPIAIGYSCCYMLHACDKTRDFDRGAQWCARVRAFSERARFNVLLAVCRAHHGSVLVGRGEWPLAEAELEASARALAVSRPGLLGEALVRLAGLRRRQGRFEEASDLLQQLGGDPVALAEQARLALDRADARTAAALAERVSRRLPAHNQADRASLLELLLEAQVALGERALAAETLTELERVAREPTAVQAAALRLCQGLLARLAREPVAARRAFEDAVDGFERSRAPFEAARARLELARELETSGAHELAQRERSAAARAFAALGAHGAHGALERFGHASAAHAPALDTALTPPTLATEVAARPASTAAPTALSVRELEVLRLVARGASNRSIAAELGVSEFTIKRHVQNILTKLDLPTRAAAASYATRSGLA
jgi:DNA-binding NarL/FixJ family response regulator